MSSSFAFYIKCCVESEYLSQLPEVHAAYNAELEKVNSEHVRCRSTALKAAEHLTMLKIDGVVGPIWEEALTESARAAAAERIAFTILEGVKLENKVCDAFYNWVQWRYQLRPVEEVHSEIRAAIESMPTKSEELITFWRNFSKW
jgi:hypothetical protein